MRNVNVLKITDANFDDSGLVLTLFNENENNDYAVRVNGSNDIRNLCDILSMKSAKTAKTIQKKIVGKVCLAEFENDFPIRILDRRDENNYCELERN